MAKVVGVIASVLVGLVLASGVTWAISDAAAPDKDVNLENPATPNGVSVDGGTAVVNYGSR